MLRQSSLALLFAAAAAVAVPQALAPSEVKSNPTVIELFTSQSCYSCPPAEAFLGELVEERSDILALEFHVDYWDELVHRGSKWKDVFSSPDSTQRQRVYNVSIRGRASVYTPQMIIGGAAEAVGSNRGNVLAALSQASGQGQPVEVSIEEDGAGFRVTIDGAAAEDATVWYVEYLREHTTEVLRGENKGKFLTNHNIVREFRSIGEWRGKTVSLDIADIDLPPDHGCAILVQTVNGDDNVPGPILGAGVCPQQNT